MAKLTAIGVPFLWRLPELEFFALFVELGDGVLIHDADPRIVIPVEFQIQSPFRPSRLYYRKRIWRYVAGLRVHRAEEHLAKVGVPSVAFAIGHHIVRLDQRSRQIILGDDHMRRLAGEPRQRLERKRPRRLLTQIDGGKPFRRLPAAPSAFNIPSCRAGQALRFQRRAAGIVEAHAPDDVHETVGIVGRLHDAFQRVASGAVKKKILLLVAARNAQEPFRIGEMGGKILHLLELDLGLRFLAWSDVRSPRAIELVAGRTRFQRVVSGPESYGRKSKAPLSVGDNADADCRAVLFRADYHAFHQTLLSGGHLPY